MIYFYVIFIFHFQNDFGMFYIYIYLLHFPEQTRESVMRQTVWRNRVKNIWKRAQFSFSKHIHNTTIYDLYVIKFSVSSVQKKWVQGQRCIEIGLSCCRLDKHHAMLNILYKTSQTDKFSKSNTSITWYMYYLFTYKFNLIIVSGECSISRQGRHMFFLTFRYIA